MWLYGLLPRNTSGQIVHAREVVRIAHLDVVADVDRDEQEVIDAIDRLENRITVFVEDGIDADQRIAEDGPFLELVAPDALTDACDAPVARIVRAAGVDDAG